MSNTVLCFYGIDVSDVYTDNEVLHYIHTKLFLPVHEVPVIRWRASDRLRSNIRNDLSICAEVGISDANHVKHNAFGKKLYQTTDEW